MKQTSAPPALLRIIGSGAVTAVGTSAWQSAASWVGGQRRNRRSVHPELGEQSVTLAACTELTANTDGLARLSSLLAAAMADLFATTPVSSCERPARALLALPEGMDDDSAQALWQLTVAQLRRYGHGPRLTQVAFSHSASGAAGAFEALAELFGAAASAGPTLLAGVDTLLDTARLRADYTADRLHTDANADGWIPGEAAGCVLLAATRDTRAETDREWVLHPPALAHASRPHLDPELPPEPDALAQTLRAALAHARWQGKHVGRVLSDSDGSTWRAKAHALARLRASDSLAAPDWTPASVTGYIGAASAPVHWALAAQRLRHDPQPPNSVLSCILDPGTAAAAVALERTLRT